MLRRAFFALVVLYIALTLNFVLPRIMPGDPVDMITGGVKLSAEAKQALLVRFGLDKPVWIQYILYISNAVRGDFGVSFFHYPQTVWGVIADALPWSLLITLTSTFLQFIIGVILGITAAWKPGTKTDAGIQTVSLALWSTPLFWIAMMFLYLFAFMFDWFPLGGAYTFAGAIVMDRFEFTLDVLRHATLPIIVLTVSWFTQYQLIMRNTMSSVIREPFILAAEAKGLSDNAVKYRHAARNALLPVVTMLGLRFSMAVGGVIFIETVFSYPGIGKLIFDSVTQRDYPVLQGCFFIFSFVVISANFVVDVIYTRLDPRVRF